MLFADTTWQDVALYFLMFTVPYIVVRLEQARKRGIETQKEVKQTLALSNGNMTDQKKLLVVSSKALAAAEPTPENHALAETAQQSLEEHLTAETKVVP